MMKSQGSEPSTDPLQNMNADADLSETSVGSIARDSVGLEGLPHSGSSQLLAKIWVILCLLVFCSAFIGVAIPLVSVVSAPFVCLASFQLVALYCALATGSYHRRLFTSAIAILIFFLFLVAGLLPLLMGSWMGWVAFRETVFALVWMGSFLVFVTQVLLFGIRFLLGWQFHHQDEPRGPGLSITDMLAFTFVIALSLAVMDQLIPGAALWSDLFSTDPQISSSIVFKPTLYTFFVLAIMHMVSAVIPVAVLFMSKTTEAGCLSLFLVTIFMFGISGLVFAATFSFQSGVQTALLGGAFLGAGVGVVVTAVTATVMCVMREEGIVLSTKSKPRGMKL